MILPKLYIKDSKGKPREWSCHTDGNKIVVSHGLVGGKIAQKATKAKPKNIGKSNETTAEEQAILEAKSKWEHQISREDYHQDINLSGKQIRPMLALDYLKVPKRVDWTQVVVQPKLDGLRLTAGRRYSDRDYFEMMSRKGETYHLPHLVDTCKEILSEVNKLCGGRCLALDGEAYLHGLPLQTITSLARKYQKGKTEDLEYHIFDLIIPNMPFIERYDILNEVCLSKMNRWGKVQFTDNYPGDKNSIDNVLGTAIQRGYEGVMLRHKDSLYTIGKRSAGLFKYKKFLDDEFLIVDVWEDKNNNAMLTCINHLSGEDSLFDCTPKRTHEVRKQMLIDRDKYIGKWITVKYQALTEDKVPQFPVGLGIRECNDLGESIL